MLGEQRRGGAGPAEPRRIKPAFFLHGFLNRPKWWNTGAFGEFNISLSRARVRARA